MLSDSPLLLLLLFYSVEVRGWTVCFTAVMYNPNTDVEHGRKETVVSASLEESAGNALKATGSRGAS